MKIAIIGAGMAGLGAARTLVRMGYDVTLWDKGKSVGGRVGTRRLGHNGQTTRFDHGAQNVKSSGTALEAELQRINFNGRVFIDAPVCLRDGERVLDADARANAEAKWTGTHGLRDLPRVLAQGLDVRLETRVAHIEEECAGLILRDENGHILDRAERVIVTCPAPQTAVLLESSTLLSETKSRIEALRAVEYSRCLSVMLQFDFSAQLDYYALLAQDRSEPLLWLACENAKRGFVAKGTTALVAQLGDAASCQLWEADDAEIVGQTIGWLQHVEPKFFNPVAHFVKRWRYSQPKNPIAFDNANSPEDRVLVCGDSVAQGRVAAAWDSGAEAAHWLISNHKSTSFNEFGARATGEL